MPRRNPLKRGQMAVLLRQRLDETNEFAPKWDCLAVGNWEHVSSIIQDETYQNPLAHLVLYQWTIIDGMRYVRQYGKTANLHFRVEQYLRTTENGQYLLAELEDLIFRSYRLAGELQKGRVS